MREAARRAQREVRASHGRRAGPTSLRDAVGAWLESSGLAASAGETRALGAWRKAAGAALCRRAQPVSLRAGVLVVELQSSAHLNELKNFAGEELRARANALLGSERIARVEYRLRR